MIFSSVFFLFYFLPIVLGIYFLVPNKCKNLVLFISSLFFYAWGEPIYILLMLFSTVVDFVHGKCMEKYAGNRKIQKRILLSSVLINLSLLGFFKYTDFFISNINAITGSDIPLLLLPLPIGISFYTFQTMSYTIDIYRGNAKAQTNIVSFGAYVSLFPQLIAGPIVQYKTISEALFERKVTKEQVSDGVFRFLCGLGKKILIANNIGALYDLILGYGVGTVSVLTCWLCVLAFSLQIYFDFSGYSDMAIGLGKIFGFEFLENFNYPYLSKSITEFWRRWHISLGTWFREYVYIPLGGNRCSSIKWIRNILIVWFVTGFWHGANWNYIIWGLYFGLLLLFEKKYLSSIPKSLRRIYTLFLLLIGWVIFAFESLPEMILCLKNMFNLAGNAFFDDQFLYLISNYGLLLCLGILFSTNIPYTYYKKIENDWIRCVFYCVVLLATTAYLVQDTYNPFLYFRF